MRAGNQNIKGCTALIKLLFLVFYNLILNCGPFKSTLSILSLIVFFFALLKRWQYVLYVEEQFIDVRETE